MTLFIPSHFRVDDAQALDDFIGKNAFATLVSSGSGGLAVSHVPLLPERAPDGALRLLGHVARANPHWRSLEEAREVLAIFHGPHAYVSPTWYEHHPSVPTWNYAVVHAHGRARLIDREGLAALVERLAATYESGRPSPWRVQDAPREFIEKMLGAIVGFAIEVERLEGKFKLSQNRPGDDAKRAANALEAEGEDTLAALMRSHPPVR